MSSSGKINPLNAIGRMMPLYIILATATQLRLPSIPIGLSDFLLLVVLSIEFFGIIQSQRVNMVYPKSEFHFWVFSFALLTIGLVWGLWTGINTNPDFRSFVAYSVCAYISCKVSFFAESRLFKYRLGSFVLTAIVLLNALLIILYTFLPSLSVVNPWYYETRLSGWTSNPNQLGMFVTPLPFLALFLVKQSKGIWKRLFYLVLGILSITIGLLTDSDALKLSWIIGFGLLVLDFWLRIYKKKTKSLLKFALFGAFLPGVILISLFIFASPIISTISNIVELVYARESGGVSQGDARTTLWANCVQVIAASPIWGFGAGSFSGIPLPFDGMECHNSYLDWGTNTGLLGVAIFALYASGVLRKVWPERLLFLGLAALFIGAFFGYYFRHPIFWVYLAWLPKLALVPGSPLTNKNFATSPIINLTAAARGTA